MPGHACPLGACHPVVLVSSEHHQRSPRPINSGSLLETAAGHMTESTGGGKVALDHALPLSSSDRSSCFRAQALTLSRRPWLGPGTKPPELCLLGPAAEGSLRGRGRAVPRHAAVSLRSASRAVSRHRSDPIRPQDFAAERLRRVRSPAYGIRWTDCAGRSPSWPLADRPLEICSTVSSVLIWVGAASSGLPPTAGPERARDDPKGQRRRHSGRASAVRLSRVGFAVGKPE